MRNNRRASGSSRRGITLFEVVIALAIFLGALAIITQILQNGSRANVRSRLAAEAAMLADSKMNEIACGYLPLETVTRSAFETAGPEWTWSLTIGETEVLGLLELVVTVENLRPDGTPIESFQLSRLMRDPQVYIDAATLSTEGT